MPIPYQKSYGGTNIIPTELQLSSSSFNAKGYEGNATDISANATDISTNKTAISANATAIANIQNRTICEVSFNGSSNINIPYSNVTGLTTIPNNNNQLGKHEGEIDKSYYINYYRQLVNPV